MLSAGTYGL